MKSTKMVILAVILLVTGSAAFGQAPTSADSLGKALVNQLWKDMKTGNIEALRGSMAPCFQSVHEDGSRTIDQQLDLIAKLKLSDYTISDLKATMTGLVLVASYKVSVSETIKGKRLDKKPAMRLSAWVKTDAGWQWAAHVNLKPMK